MSFGRSPPAVAPATRMHTAMRRPAARTAAPHAACAAAAAAASPRGVETEDTVMFFTWCFASGGDLAGGGLALGGLTLEPDPAPHRCRVRFVLGAASPPRLTRCSGVQGSGSV